MAFNPTKKFPGDALPNVAVGVSIPFNAPGVFFQTFTTADQLKSNLTNYFLTNKRERVFNPNFGGNLRAQIFEQISKGNIAIIEKIIKNDLKLYFPNVELVELNILGYEDNNSLEISLTYRINNFGIQDTLNLTL
jgi:phage baseplate assembly protein W